MIKNLLNFFSLSFIKKHWEIYALIIILIIASILRFYNFPYRYSLGEETIRDAVIGIEGAREIQFPLTGSFSSLGPFTFGPWYAYQLIFFYWLAPSVYSPWIYLSIISVLYIFIMYKIGEILFNKKFGLVLAFLVALSPAQIISATHLTSHNNTNLFAALSIWIFLKIVRYKPSVLWGILLGLAIGVGMNLHFQMSGLLILPFTLVLYRRNYYKYLLSSLGGVFVTFVPMMFFELNNHWFNTKNIVTYIMHGRYSTQIPNRWFFYLRDFWPSFWSDALGIPIWAGSFIIILSLIFLGLYIYKRKLTLSFSILLITFLFNFILLRFYWGPRFFGYLNYLRPFVFILTVFSIFSLSKTRIGIYGASLLLILMVLLSYPNIIYQLQKDPFTVDMYKNVQEVKRKYPSNGFVLYTCSKEYNGSYNASAFSILLLLEKEHKINENGVKIGVEKDCAYPKRKNIEEKYVFLSEMGIVDFSTLSKEELKNAGWKPITFASLYDNYARWWFELQP